jgi:hypothetical protein
VFDTYSNGIHKRVLSFSAEFNATNNCLSKSHTGQKVAEWAICVRERPNGRKIKKAAAFVIGLLG